MFVFSYIIKIKLCLKKIPFELLSCTHISIPVIEAINKNNKLIVDVMAHINVFQLHINKGWIEYLKVINTTTTGGYFAIHISSQTTKKEVFKNSHLRTITPRKLLSLCNTTTFAPVQLQVLHNSRTWHNRKPFMIVTASIYRLWLTLHRKLFATNPSLQRLGESTQKSIGFRNKVYRKPLAAFWESQQVCVRSYIGNHANFLGFSECR